MSNDQLHAVTSRPPDVSAVRVRPGPGGKLVPYLDINEARRYIHRIIGTNPEKLEITYKDDDPTFLVSARSKCSLTVNNIHVEGSGVSVRGFNGLEEYAKNSGNMLKTAQSDALKRALALLGPGFNVNDAIQQQQQPRLVTPPRISLPALMPHQPQPQPRPLQPLLSSSSSRAVLFPPRRTPEQIAENKRLALQRRAQLESERKAAAAAQQQSTPEARARVEANYRAALERLELSKKRKAEKLMSEREQKHVQSTRETYIQRNIPFGEKEEKITRMSFRQRLDTRPGYQQRDIAVEDLARENALERKLERDQEFEKKLIDAAEKLSQERQQEAAVAPPLPSSPPQLSAGVKQLLLARQQRKEDDELWERIATGEVEVISQPPDDPHENTESQPLHQPEETFEEIQAGMERLRQEAKQLEEERNRRINTQRAAFQQQQQQPQFTGLTDGQQQVIKNAILVTRISQLNDYVNVLKNQQDTASQLGFITGEAARQKIQEELEALSAEEKKMIQKPGFDKLVPEVAPFVLQFKKFKDSRGFAGKDDSEIQDELKEALQSGIISADAVELYGQWKERMYPKVRISGQPINLTQRNSAHHISRLRLLASQN